MSRVVTMAELVLVMQHLSRQVGRCNGSRLPTGHTASTSKPVASDRIEIILAEMDATYSSYVDAEKPTILNTYSNNSNQVPTCNH